jgi:hypothetical protein
MTETLLEDVRNTLDEDFQHPIIGYTLSMVGVGSGVLGTGLFFFSTGAPEYVFMTAMILAGAPSAAFSWYILIKLGC